MPEAKKRFKVTVHVDLTAIDNRAPADEENLLMPLAEMDEIVAEHVEEALTDIFGVNGTSQDVSMHVVVKHELVDA
jgi:hypothetical protein